MLKRISITHSREIGEHLEMKPPTKGMLAAFQLGCDVWCAANGGESPRLTCLISHVLFEKGGGVWVDGIAIHNRLIGFVAELKDKCNRVTISHSLHQVRDSRGCSRIEICGLDNNEEVSSLKASFADNGILMSYEVS